MAKCARQAAGLRRVAAMLLNRMERDGLVQRMADPTDRRSRLISLTDSASRRMHKGKAIMDATCEKALEGFSVAEITQLTRLLGRVSANLERAAEDQRDAAAG